MVDRSGFQGLLLTGTVCYVEVHFVAQSFVGDIVVALLR